MKKSFLKLAVLFVMALASVQNTELNADVILTIDPASQIAPNASSRISVSITGLGDDLSLVAYEFRIRPLATTSSQLMFLEEDESFLADSDYLFFGNSFAFNEGSASNIGSVSTSVLPGDTFIGGDAAADFGNVTLNGSKLLVELMVQHDSGSAGPLTTLGDTFAIDLFPLSGDSTQFTFGNSNTGFVDAALAEVGFTSTSGNVVVVPEASSLIVLSLACPLALRRRRK